ncbi:MAG TPA: hypothetical protein VGM20_08890 [Gemmatimonadales bacterium]|jgi:hypothetical protein
MKWVLAIAALVTLAAPVQSQGPTRLGLSARAAPIATASRQPFHDNVGQTEWKKGAIIGGVIGVALGLVFAQAHHSLCDESHNCSDHDIVVFFGTTAICALLGGFIGSGIHKKE